MGKYISVQSYRPVCQDDLDVVSPADILSHTIHKVALKIQVLNHILS